MKPISIAVTIISVAVVGLASDAHTARGADLPLPSATDVESSADLPVPASEKYPVEWANPGSLGPTGLLAQRGLQSLEYKVLGVEVGSPAYGKLLPGDLIVGVDGKCAGAADDGVGDGVAVIRITS